MKNRLPKHVPFVGLAVIAVAMFMGSWSSEAAAMPWLSNTSSFPIPGSRYDSQNGVMIGPEVEILSMSLVPKRGQVEPPPPGGSFQVDSFFDVFTELSLNGGASFSVDSFFDVFTELSITNVSTNPNDTPQQFDTEIISMSLTGDVGGTPVIIQALPSPGQTTITDLGGGQWEVDSFFDVFVEISVDGGPWMVATQPLRMPGTPEPATLVVLMIGGSLALLRRRA